MTRTILDITGTDLQGRGGPRQLRDRLREYLRAERPPVGTPLSTDAELSEHFQLSRSSVRRAMADLQAEGWIDRQVGRGTFVGPRVALDAAESRADIVDPGTTDGTSDQAPGSLSATGSSKRSDAGTIRLSVVVFWNADVISNWYTSGILRGLGDVAHDFNVSVELISLGRPNPDAVLRRLEQNRPDVVAFPTGDVQEMLVIRDAQRLNIPMVVAGTKFSGVGVPRVDEDNDQAINLAVDHLHDAGHQDVALLLSCIVAPFGFERQAAFFDAHTKKNLPIDGDSVHWIRDASDDAVFEAEVARLADYLRRRRPSAVICGNSNALEAAGQAVKRLGWSIPNDLSLVTIDQIPEATGWLYGVTPTVVEIPLEEMGRAIGRFTTDLAQSRDVPAITKLPCRLREGESVARRT